MRKKLFIISIIVYSSLLAQTAPNLVVTDLNGVTHNVYDYLDEGKSVLLDFFILNCTPCEEGAGYMDEFWESYGPNGNDQMQILSLEVYDNSDEIVEETTNNWGINNPIINLNYIPTSYIPFVEVYPNYIMICPDRSMNIIYGFDYPLTLLQWEQLLNNCSFGNNYTDITIFEPELTHCEGHVFANLNIGNVGSNFVQGIEIDVFADSTYIETINWNYILPPGLATNSPDSPSPSITFENSNINSSTIRFEVRVNGDSNLNNNDVTIDLTDEIITSNTDINIKIQTDYYPIDLLWTLVDANSNIIAEGEGTNYEPNELITVNLELDTLMCYRFIISDEHGDGICCDWGNGYYLITAGEDTLIYNNTFLSHNMHSFYIDGLIEPEDISIEETNLHEFKIIHSEFFNLKGQQINYPNKAGTYIRKDHYEHGLTKNSKIIISAQ